MGKEPWKRSFAASAVSEKFLQLRHRMIPYLYTANYQTHTQGIPVCMPMYYVHDSEDAYHCKNEYYFGSKLLVCPITQPADKQLNLAYADVWLPEGRWTDFFTGRIYRGVQWVAMHRDIDSIPVLAGEGTIIPMYANGESNDLSLDQPLEIHIWRGNGCYELYEDDGETKCSDHVITRMAVTESGNTLRFVIHPAEGKRELLPEKRKVNLIFRDVLSADVYVSGNREFSPKGVGLLVSADRETVVELTNVIPMENPDPKQLRSDLLTRFQGDNLWKNLVFCDMSNLNSRKIPASVRRALKEIDALI
jgi:hypothetical protein